MLFTFTSVDMHYLIAIIIHVELLVLPGVSSSRRQRSILRTDGCQSLMAGSPTKTLAGFAPTEMRILNRRKSQAPTEIRNLSRRKP